MLDELIRLVVAALAVWRISVAIWYEDGPFDQYKYFRAWVERKGKPEMGMSDDGSVFIHHYIWEGIWHQLDCFWCVTFWVSLPIAVIITLPWYWWTALVPFALSGAAILLSGAGRTIWRATNE